MDEMTIMALISLPLCIIMKFGSVINIIVVLNPVKQNINIRLIMAMESEYIQNFHKKRNYNNIFIYYLNSLDHGCANHDMKEHASSPPSTAVT